MAAELWRDGIETRGPFVLVVGWQTARHASLEQITHLCADDITELTTVSRPAAEPAPAELSQSRQELRAVGSPAAPGGPAGPDGEIKKKRKGKPDRVKPDSRLHLDSTRLARDARAAQERAKHQDDKDGPSWQERVVHWQERAVHLFDQLTGVEPGSGRPPQERPLQERPQRSQTASHASAPGPAAARAEADAGAGPEPQPDPRPVEIQLPKRPEAAEPFEGLE
jgi:hypothetical protein